jgi:hypothetical protein
MLSLDNIKKLLKTTQELYNLIARIFMLYTIEEYLMND